jgi:hypothetical protein
MKKKCRECKAEKDIHKFYTHSDMPDGYLNQCKECVKKRIHNHYNQNIEIMRKKERDRFQRRKNNPEYIAIRNKATIKYRETHKRIDHNLHRDLEKYIPDNCTMCGIHKSKIYSLHGHHSDYRKPKSVIWVCPACHKEIHLSKR